MSAPLPSPHVEASFAAMILSAGMVVLTLTGVMSPYWLWLDNVSGTDAETGAETLLDKFQGLWYRCTFRLQGTPSGVDIQQRQCVPTSSLVAGVSVPEQINAMQVLTVITVVLCFAMFFGGWSGSRRAHGIMSAAVASTRGLLLTTLVGLFNAVFQIAVVITYATDTFIVNERATTQTSGVFTWGSGLACIATSGALSVVVSIVAGYAFMKWKTAAGYIAELERQIAADKASAVAAIPAPAPFRHPEAAPAADPASPEGKLADAKRLRAEANELWSDCELAMRAQGKDDDVRALADRAIAATEKEHAAALEAQRDAEARDGALAGDEEAPVDRTTARLAHAQAVQAEKRITLRRAVVDKHFADKAAAEAEADKSPAAAAAAAAPAAEPARRAPAEAAAEPAAEPAAEAAAEPAAEAAAEPAAEAAAEPAAEPAASD
ncbi:hypothetical protein FNF31_05021 [Cafeteria roenbergensis]|uniref:Claudin n=1 Tax=Cafeteria roenbergensis TaxID=33653 RepID=A0A5A8D274_CAFRO|nr:hypothetical protein FNF31_05021 [Cafeteria roenbergensis]